MLSMGVLHCSHPKGDYWCVCLLDLGFYYELAAVASFGDVSIPRSSARLAFQSLETHVSGVDQELITVYR